MSLQPSSPNNRLFLGCFIESVSIGRSFPRSDWPLHVTIVPWFLCSRPNKLDAKLDEAIESLSRFEVKAGGEAMFGSKKNIRVNLIRPNQELMSLHQGLLKIVRDLGGIDVDEQFTGDGYRPHVTQVKDRRVNDGDRLSVGFVHLTELTDESRCTPLKRYGLKR